MNELNFFQKEILKKSMKRVLDFIQKNLIKNQKKIYFFSRKRKPNQYCF